MDIVKKSLPALILLFVVVMAWVGLSAYFDATGKVVDTKATGYTRALKTSFDLEELNKVMDRSKKAFPVSPDEFLSLMEKD
ncbi:MAG TPA: hypothetical protein PLS56_00130 [Candidatus Dojkabacteria bacterium]|jgi:hypothetical protein|nr:hypothetical protein [Candidatus Dojkabacteria bacterium]